MSLSTGLQVRKQIIKFLVSYKFQHFEKVFNQFFPDNYFANIKYSILFSLKNYIRNHLLINYYFKSLIKKPNKLPDIIIHIIKFGIFQLSFQTKIPDYSIINESVELTKIFNISGLSKLVNGVLRNFLKEKEALDKKLNKNNLKNISIKYSFPEWIIKRWEKQFQKNELLKLLEFYNQMDFKISICILFNKENFLKQLDENKINYFSSDYFNEIIYLESTKEIINNPKISENQYIIIDESSILPIYFFNFQKPEKYNFLEVGAFPGGKSVLINSKIPDNCELYLIDKNPDKKEKFLYNQKRYSIKYKELIINDFLKTEFKIKFEKILLDSPCSALGTIRKNPEIKFNRQNNDIQKIATLQYELLEKGINILKEGGELVYSICSFEKEETKEVIKRLLSKNKNIELSKENNLPEMLKEKLVYDSGYYCYPFKTEIPGFFIAKIIKKNN